MFREQGRERGTQDRDIANSIAAKPVTHGLGQCLAQCREIAVEIAAIRKVEPANRVAQNVLRKTNGVRDRHEDNLAADVARRFPLQQRPAQGGDTDHAGDLVGMERGLDVNRRPRPALAEAMEGQAEGSAVAARGDVDLFGNHARTGAGSADLGWRWRRKRRSRSFTKPTRVKVIAK